MNTNNNLIQTRKGEKMSKQNNKRSNIEGSDFLSNENSKADEVTTDSERTELTDSLTDSSAKKSKYGFNKDDRWKKK